MNISKATLADIPTIQQIASQSWQETYAKILSDNQIRYMLKMMYSEAALQKHFAQPTYRYFLFTENGHNVGFAGFEHHFADQTTKLHRIYFLQQAQGKGYGRKAIDFVKEQSLLAGDRRIILTVNKNNSARKAYEKMGFKIYGEEVANIGEGYVMDDFLMEIQVPPVVSF